MKKSIFILILGTLLLCSCKLENGRTNKHTAAEMESYTKMMFSDNIIKPAITIKNLIELDRYIYDPSSFKLGDEFSWHRNNIYHEDDVTFKVPFIGTVKTYGKSLFDENAKWEFNYKYERLGEKSWKIYHDSYNDNFETYSIITYEGRDEKGNNILKIEAYDTDKYQTSYPATVTAVAATPEGPMTLHMATDFSFKSYYAWGYSDVPEGKGVFRIDTERYGKPLDWMELRYSETGKMLEFRCNL